MTIMNDYLENNTDNGIDFDNFNIEQEIEKFKDYSPSGYQVIVRLYTTPEKTAGGIIKPQKSRDEDKYNNYTGLVVSMGSAAYKGERFKFANSYCEVGDFIAFPRHSGHRLSWHGIPLFSINDDAVLAVIKNPKQNIPFLSK